MTDHTVPAQRDEWEALRMDREWPTPMHMRRAADSLDALTPARYGDMLRWVADLCDGVEPEPPSWRKRNPACHGCGKAFETKPSLSYSIWPVCSLECLDVVVEKVRAEEESGALA